MKQVEIATTALEPWDVRPEDFDGFVPYNVVNLKLNAKGEVEVDPPRPA